MNLLAVLAILSGAHSLSVVGPEEVRSWVHDAVTVHCRYSQRYRGHVKYWCKGRFPVSCPALVKTDGSVTHKRTSIRDDQSEGEFTVTMKNLSVEDDGWYHCGISVPGVSSGDETASVYISVRDPSTPGLQSPGKVSVQLSSSATVRCSYSAGYKSNNKYWCRGAKRADCSTVVNTEDHRREGRTSIRDDPAQRTFTVTISDLSLEDEGWYWCGIERSFSFSDELAPVFLTVTDTRPSAPKPGMTEGTEITTTGFTETSPVTSGYLTETEVHTSPATEEPRIAVWSVVRWLLFCVMLAGPVTVTCWQTGTRRTCPPAAHT
ncbi:PIGR protein, partial [Atractosteus spatula]|nr:PIGR protein [Atractosteus spatula]